MRVRFDGLTSSFIYLTWCCELQWLWMIYMTLIHVTWNQWWQESKREPCGFERCYPTSTIFRRFSVYLGTVRSWPRARFNIIFLHKQEMFDFGRNLHRYIQYDPHNFMSNLTWLGRYGSRKRYSNTLLSATGSASFQSRSKPLVFSGQQHSHSHEDKLSYAFKETDYPRGNTILLPSSSSVATHMRYSMQVDAMCA